MNTSYDHDDKFQSQYEEGKMNDYSCFLRGGELHEFKSLSNHQWDDIPACEDQPTKVTMDIRGSPTQFIYLYINSCMVCNPYFGLGESRYNSDIEQGGGKKEQEQDDLCCYVVPPPIDLHYMQHIFTQ